MLTTMIAMSLEEFAQGKRIQYYVNTDKGKKWIPNGYLHNGKLYSKQSVGYGKVQEKVCWSGGDADVIEEYEHYKNVLVPIWNASLIEESERERISKMSKGDQYNYSLEHSEYLFSMGENPGGKIAESTLQEEYDKYVESVKDLHVGKVVSEGNLGTIEHYILSARISRSAWNSIKHLMEYADGSKFHDEIWGDCYKGFALKDKGSIELLESILGIPKENSFAELQKRKEEARKQLLQVQAQAKERTDRICNSIEELFDPAECLPLTYELREEYSTEQYHIPEGQIIEHLCRPRTIYGTGEWFVVLDNQIWRVFNNGNDGDNWSYNWIHTGGAGAYGFAFERTVKRMTLLEEMQNS